MLGESVLSCIGMRRSESWRDWLVLKFLTRRRSLPYISYEKRSAPATSWVSMNFLARISITENAGSKKSSSSLQPISESTFWLFRVCRITFIYCSGHGQTSLRLGTIPKLRCVGGSCVRRGCGCFVSTSQCELTERTARVWADFGKAATKPFEFSMKSRYWHVRLTLI